MRMQSSHSDSDRGLDAYFTPIEAVLSLIEIEKPFLAPDRVIWEPACGDGAIVNPFREAGFQVFGSDIYDYCDGKFPIMDYLTAPKHPRIGAVITNPPFKLAIDFAKKALNEAPYVAFLLRTNWLESQERLSFFRQYPFSRIWISSRRLPQMHRFGWDGPEAPSNICYAWFVWDLNSEDCLKLDWFDWADFSGSSSPRRRIDFSKAMDLDL